MWAFPGIPSDSRKNIVKTAVQNIAGIVWAFGWRRRTATIPTTTTPPPPPPPPTTTTRAHQIRKTIKTFDYTAKNFTVRFTIYRSYNGVQRRRRGAGRLRRRWLGRISTFPPHVRQRDIVGILRRSNNARKKNVSKGILSEETEVLQPCLFPQ